MTADTSKPTANEPFENPRLLGLGGMLLLLLGVVTLVIAFIREVLSADLQVVVVAIIMLMAGYTMLLHSRALAKIAMLEARVKQLEEKSK